MPQNEPGRVLVTGGAGFIGRYVVRALAAQGERVVILDSLDSEGPPTPAAIRQATVAARDDGAEILHPHRVEHIEAVVEGLAGCTRVVHLATGVSVAASYEEPSRFVGPNVLGTAVLFEAIRRVGGVKRVVVASSMSVYGHADFPVLETNLILRPASIYGLSKLHQEQLALLAGKLYGVEVTALRLWNCYGEGQSLTNAETGVAAIFAARLLAGEAPLIFEDGQQRREFVYVTDVARAFTTALASRWTGVANIGSGEVKTVLELARALSQALTGGSIEPTVTGERRPGDVRHCVPNLSVARAQLKWTPEVSFTSGIAQYTASLTAVGRSA